MKFGNVMLTLILKSWQNAKGSWQIGDKLRKTVGKIAKNCKYISQEEYQDLRSKSEEVGRMLNHMVRNPEKYRPKQ